jgi:hypothetical protein
MRTNVGKISQMGPTEHGKLYQQLEDGHTTTKTLQLAVTKAAKLVPDAPETDADHDTMCAYLDAITKLASAQACLNAHNSDIAKNEHSLINWHPNT